MDAEAFDRSLRAFANRRPFRPFTVELVSGSRLTVGQSEDLVFRGGSAVHVASDGTITHFGHDGLVRLIGAAT